MCSSSNGASVVVLFLLGFGGVFFVSCLCFGLVFFLVGFWFGGFFGGWGGCGVASFFFFLILLQSHRMAEIGRDL